MPNKLNSIMPVEQKENISYAKITDLFYFAMSCLTQHIKYFC